MNSNAEINTAVALRPHRNTLHLEQAAIMSIEHFAGDQVIMRLSSPTLAARALPGQFVHVQCDPSLPMRRPMSLMRADSQAGWVDILFKVHGHGTRLLAKRRVGDTLSVLGPIGRTFRLESYRARPLLIGGGVGIPPMIFLAEHMRHSRAPVTPFVVMGSEVPFPFQARPSQILVHGLDPECIAAVPLLDDWGIASRLASQQNFPGCYRGHVTELARRWLEQSTDAVGDVEIFACGPTPMLRAVQALALEFEVRCEISIEEYMACGVGGCAGCCVSVITDEGEAMKRACVDGPVFDAASVRLSS